MGRQVEDRRHGEASGPVPGDGTLAGLVADLRLAVGQLTEQQKQERKPRPQIPWEACRPVGFAIGQNIPLTAGAGTLGVTQDNYGPTPGYWWDLRRLSVWGFTAGTVTVYLNQQGGEQLAVFTTVGEFTWGAQKLLAGGDSLIWVASGITGTVQVAGQAIEVLAEWLPEYLM